MAVEHLLLAQRKRRVHLLIGGLPLAFLDRQDESVDGAAEMLHAFSIIDHHGVLLVGGEFTRFDGNQIVRFFRFGFENTSQFQIVTFFALLGLLQIESEFLIRLRHAFHGSLQRGFGIFGLNDERKDEAGKANQRGKGESGHSLKHEDNKRKDKLRRCHYPGK